MLLPGPLTSSSGLAPVLAKIASFLMLRAVGRVTSHSDPLTLVEAEIHAVGSAFQKTESALHKAFLPEALICKGPPGCFCHELPSAVLENPAKEGDSLIRISEGQAASGPIFRQAMYPISDSLLLFDQPS